MQNEDFVSEVCHEFQEAAIDVLVGKTERALQEHSPDIRHRRRRFGHVWLRNRLRNLLDERFPDTKFLTPEFRYSLDNAAMTVWWRLSASLLSHQPNSLLAESWHTLFT